MNIYFIKKKILILFLMCLVFPFDNINAVDIVASDDIVVSARVIDPNVVVTPVPVPENPAGAVNLFIPKIGVAFKGEAYPNAKIYLLKDGVLTLTVNADSGGDFVMSIEEKYENTAMYTIYAEDFSGVRSLLLNYPVVVSSGYITELSNIRFAPTVSIDKSEVALGDYITLSGYSMPNRVMSISLEGINQKTYYITSLSDGSYTTTLSLSNLIKGSYTLNIKYINDSRISKFIKFIIGDVNKDIRDFPTTIPGDCNKDNVINLIDFSVMAFWYKKNNPPECVDLNNDNIVNLIDFSILAYFWTN